MKKFLKEPLFHFLLIGTLLFGLFYIINPSEDKEEIIIDTDLVNELVAKWGQKRNREPSLNEVKGLISEYLEQEIFYREALKMNLDHNDEIVKRRLAQKMQFISDELAETLQPTEKMLRDFYEENKDDYKKPAIFTLEQLYFSPDKRDDATADAKKIIASNNIPEKADGLSLPKKYENTSGTKIAIDFGTRFANTIDTLKIGTWQGPINSGFGVHLVKVHEKIPAGYYSFEETQRNVVLDYNFEANNKFKNQLLNSLLENYEVVYDLESKELMDEN
ncbi:MAG: hypothetical protein BM563_00870 [Bacteroidetes bacterium MedPE-SWsnd-G1]|nr:MAG: hypothetical protein BM563_00870 [Bacteroidetes bacterium MedPE-SWsnd-G1]